MELKQALGNTWYFEGLELIPLYRLDARRCILLDSGLKSEREDLVASLNREGLLPVGVFSSHAHRDHSINNAYLRETYGSRLCLPAGEAALCSSLILYKASYDNLSLRDLEAEFGDIICQTDEAVGPEDGSYRFCGAVFEVIHTPGHTPDHICVVTPDGVCYTADAFLFGRQLTRSLLPYNYCHTVALQSLEKLRASRCAVYLAAHKGVFSALGPVIDENIVHLYAVEQEVLSLMERPKMFDDILTAFIAQNSLYTSKLEKASRYARSLRTLLEHMTETGKLQITVSQGLGHYSKPE